MEETELEGKLEHDDGVIWIMWGQRKVAEQIARNTWRHLDQSISKQNKKFTSSSAVMKILGEFDLSDQKTISRKMRLA